MIRIVAASRQSITVATFAAETYFQMKFIDLPKIEQEAIELLLQGEEPISTLRRQLDAVSGVDRTLTGVGVYVDFEFGNVVEPLKDLANFNIDNVFAHCEKCGDIGFILFIRDGRIAGMEAYTYSDEYPSYEYCDLVLYRKAAECSDDRPKE